ncbi:hypothetical protein H5410_060125 [Solanum commersonii]|uniref:Uncharacterized protein n=1 Tax=Solanum commersonii TaxID=4109 RepID=A0A9J5W4Q2_SOLCO|nr:hypothetical protein H5410_060125 [Solanum commersonii]
MPAVINTISEPLRAFAMPSFDSSAACSPNRGFPPVPASLDVTYINISNRQEGANQVRELEALQFELGSQL